MHCYSVTNVHKPPDSSIDNRTIPTITPQSIVCRDFISRCTSWGYSDTTAGGSTLVAYAEIKELYLLYDVKDYSTFYSGRHEVWSNLDLSYISTDISPLTVNGPYSIDSGPGSGHYPQKGRMNSLQNSTWKAIVVLYLWLIKMS